MDRETLLVLLTASSVIEFGSAAELCDLTSYCGGRVGFAVAVGVISFLAAGFFLAMSKFGPIALDGLEVYFAGFLTLWWICGAAVNTGPRGRPSSGVDQHIPFHSCTFCCLGAFPVTGNGYLASWASLILSGIWLRQEISRMWDLNAESTPTSRDREATDKNDSKGSANNA